MQVDCCVPFARSEYLIKKAFGKLGSNANIPTGCVYSALQSIALTKKQVETNQEKISVIQERIEKLHSAVRVLNSIPKVRLPALHTQKFYLTSKILYYYSIELVSIFHSPFVALAFRILMLCVQ